MHTSSTSSIRSPRRPPGLHIHASASSLDSEASNQVVTPASAYSLDDVFEREVSRSIEFEISKQLPTTGSPLFERVLGCFFAGTFSSVRRASVFFLVCVDVSLLLWGVYIFGIDHEHIHWTSLCHAILLIGFSLESSASVFGELRHSHKSKQPTVSRLDVESSIDVLAWSRATSNNSSRSSSFVGESFPSRCALFLDAFLILFGVLGAWVWGLHSCATIIPSMLRVCIVVGPMDMQSQHSFLKPLRLLVCTIGDSMYALFFSLCLLLLNMLFFSVLGMGLLQPAIEEQMRQDAIDRFGTQTVENCRHAFSSLLASMSTLLALSTGDQWRDIAFPIMFFRPWAFALFLLYAFIALGVVIGLVYGSICQSLQNFTARQAEIDGTAQREMKKAQKKTLMVELAFIFESIDADGSGYLTWQEFHHNTKNNCDLVRVMENLDLQESEMHLIWDIMDANRDSLVSKEEFIQFMWSVLFCGGRWPQLKLMHGAAQANYRSDEVHKQVKLLQEELFEHRRILETLLHRVTGPEEKTISGSRMTADVCKECDGSSANADPDAYFANDSANDLMRSVGAGKVTQYGSDEVLVFWGGGAFTDKSSDREYNMSHPCQRCDYFISHCWSAPQDWYSHFQRNNRLETFEYIKAVELHSVVFWSQRIDPSIIKEGSTPSDEITANKSMEDTTLWIDKCCIPQNDKKTKAVCVALIEDFMTLSDGLIVILSWQYFTRLWCVYEWACFLRVGSPSSVNLGFDAFLRSHPQETLPLYLDSIENMSVKSSQCFNPGDHEILEAKVFHYYEGKTPEESFAAFERFAKCTAICLMAKQIVLWRARGSESDENAWLEPFRTLADKLEYRRLGNVLRRAHPAKWFAQCGGNQDAFDRVAKVWFDKDCIRYLAQERFRAVRRLRTVRKDISFSRDSVLASSPMLACGSDNLSGNDFCVCEDNLAGTIDKCVMHEANPVQRNNAASNGFAATSLQVKCDALPGKCSGHETGPFSADTKPLPH